MMWIHGTSLHLQHTDRASVLTRSGSGTRIAASGVDTNWVHFAVPTTVVASGSHLAIRSVVLDFETEPGTIVSAVHVYDGPGAIATHDEDITGNHRFWELDVPKNPRVSRGIGISVKVGFGPDGGWVDFRAAGAEFITRTDLGVIYIPI